MASASSHVLEQLMRSNIWATKGDIHKFKRAVVDVDSITNFIYQLCISKNIELSNNSHKSNIESDPFLVTIVNYRQFSHFVIQFLDFFLKNNIELHLVYHGKFMEIPLFGLLPAHYKRNTLVVKEAINTLVRCHGGQTKSLKCSHFIRSNLSLNIFKSIVNMKRKSNLKIKTYQAFYSSYPLMVKLARDFSCPVLTNNADFIISDVRAGFVMMYEFWDSYINNNSADEDKKPERSPKRSKSSSRTNVSINFHYNAFFLRQHPGLTQKTAMYLFPLLSFDFLVTYTHYLQRLRVYNKLYHDEDFSRSSGDITFKQIHEEAEILEHALSYVSNKTPDLIGNFIRSEASRTMSNFDNDFSYIYDQYQVAFAFKDRLRLILRRMNDPLVLNFIERCLTERESSADYLLDVLCCSIGHLASINYNRSMQLEDIKTTHSTHSLINFSKSMLMSLYSGNKSHKSENSVSVSKKQIHAATRFSTASLTVVDRIESNLIQKSITTTHEDPHVDTIREKLSLDIVARNKASVEDRIHFMNLAFRSKDLTKIDEKIGSLIGNFLSKDPGAIREELAIVLSLSKFGHSLAASHDKYFKDNYINREKAFELAIINHYLYVNEIVSKVKHKELAPLVNLINKLDLNHTTGHLIGERSSDKSAIKGPKAKSKNEAKRFAADQMSADRTSSSHIRHQIEMLNVSLEAYYELNSFLNYPLPKINLHLNYNPILIYNLAHCLESKQENKVLFTC